MLIALVTATLLIVFGFGGASLENVFVDIKKPVKQTIENEERRGEVLKVRKDLERTVARHEKAWKRELKHILEVQADYNSTAEDFDARQSQIGELLAERQAAVLDARDQMRELMTEAEWSQIFSTNESDSQ